MYLFKFLKKKKETEFNPSIAIKLLAELTELLKEIQINSWLTDGTLLGWYREQNFIGHDKDMDIGVHISEYKESLIPHLTKNNWEVIRVLGTIQQGLELSLKKNGHKIDIFFFYEDGNQVWHAAWQGQKIDGKRYRRMIKYSYEKFNLKEIEFLNHTFSAPDNPEKYIITKYGENWRTPIKNWDWALGPANSELTDIIVSEVKRKKL